MIQIRVWNVLTEVQVVIEGSTPGTGIEDGPWKWSGLDRRSFTMPDEDVCRVLALAIHAGLVNADGYCGDLREFIES